MRVDWCVSSWFRIKNTHSLTHTCESESHEMCMYMCPYRVGVPVVGRTVFRLPIYLLKFTVTPAKLGN